MSNVARHGLLGRTLADDPRETDASRLARQRSQRILFVMAIASAMALFITYRFITIQLLDSDLIIARYQESFKPVDKDEPAPARGMIRDRNGFLLATDRTFYDIGVSPNMLRNPDEVAVEVASILDVPVSEIADAFQSDARYVQIANDVPYEVGQQIATLGTNAFVLDPVRRRAYPEGQLASQLLGFTNFDGAGQNGVELYYNELLTGTTAPELTDTPRASEIRLNHRSFMPSNENNDLILTIDRSIQFMAEQELQQAIETYQATGGTIVVMEPHSGDVLAMANAPSFDPNRYFDSEYDESTGLFNNAAVFTQYEPGSVFKIITMASAIDEGVVAPNTPYNDVGVIEVGGGIIRNWDQGAYGTRTMTEVLGYSLNTGTAWVATQLGAERFYPDLEKFGFGKATGIDVAAEATGMMKKPPEMLPDPLLPPWHPSDLGTNAFGQGISVTPIQMVSSVASLLNGGQRMQPRVVKAVVEHGVLREVAPVVINQPVSPETAATMQAMLAESVEMETPLALLDGWRIGGKTGTAQVPVQGGYHPTDTIASFIGFAPADDPAFIILVKLDRPLGDGQWGGQSAAPTFKLLAQRILAYYNIPPDAQRMARPNENTDTVEVIEP